MSTHKLTPNGITRFVELLREGIPTLIEQGTDGEVVQTAHRDLLPRTAIVFQFVPIDHVVPSDESSATVHVAPSPSGASQQLWNLPLDQVRLHAAERPVSSPEPSVSVRRTYLRSEAVRVYVLRRADGACEGCDTPAPFMTPAGRPYLEAHHTRRLSDCGPDHPAHVIALCPTCHRRAHHAADATEFNNSLMGIVSLKEI